jgi:hypothetical protein
MPRARHHGQTQHQSEESQKRTALSTASPPIEVRQAAPLAAQAVRKRQGLGRVHWSRVLAHSQLGFDERRFLLLLGKSAALDHGQPQAQVRSRRCRDLKPVHLRASSLWFY